MPARLFSLSDPPTSPSTFQCQRPFKSEPIKVEAKQTIQRGSKEILISKKTVEVAIKKPPIRPIWV